MVPPSPYVEVVGIETSTFPLGVVVTWLAFPFAVVAGWALRRRMWWYFVPATVVVIGTAAFVLSVGTWAVLLTGLLVGFLAFGYSRR
ncbi:MAG TPA: hypothetical protein VHI97_05540, partial [Actinomycetota bacterium]|nr:hypothetical protein [Actinomycetota bacterium]